MSIGANFNSIKVQVKHLSSGDTVISTLFQFHKGTSKTANEKTRNEINAISIP